MPTLHDVNTALSVFAERVGLPELVLGPDRVASAAFGDEGILTICFNEDSGFLLLVSPVGRINTSDPVEQQLVLLKAALAYNIESICSLGLEAEAGVFFLSQKISKLVGLEDEIIDFAEQSLAITKWLEATGSNLPSQSEWHRPAMQEHISAVVLKP